MTEKFLELIKSLAATYQIADPQRKRRIAELVFSNRDFRGKQPYFTVSKWLLNLEDTISVLIGGPEPVTTRTFEDMKKLMTVLKGGKYK